MQKFLLIICLLFPVSVWAIDLDKALGKITKVTKADKNSSADLIDSFGCGIKSDLLKEVNEAKSKGKKIENKINGSIDKINNRVDTAIGKFDGINAKYEQYEDLAKSYFLYLKIAVFSFTALLLIFLIIFVILQFQIRSLHNSIKKLTK